MNYSSQCIFSIFSVQCSMQTKRNLSIATIISSGYCRVAATDTIWLWAIKSASSSRVRILVRRLQYYIKRSVKGVPRCYPVMSGCIYTYPDFVKVHAYYCWHEYLCLTFFWVLTKPTLFLGVSGPRYLVKTIPQPEQNLDLNWKHNLNKSDIKIFIV